jgi:hypothetical protein
MLLLSLLAGFVAAGIGWVILYLILGVTLWVSFLVAACLLVVSVRRSRGFTRGTGKGQAEEGSSPRRGRRQGWREPPLSLLESVVLQANAAHEPTEPGAHDDRDTDEDESDGLDAEMTERFRSFA